MDPVLGSPLLKKITFFLPANPPAADGGSDPDPQSDLNAAVFQFPSINTAGVNDSTTPPDISTGGYFPVTVTVFNLGTVPTTVTFYNCTDQTQHATFQPFTSEYNTGFLASFSTIGTAITVPALGFAQETIQLPNTTYYFRVVNVGSPVRIEQVGANNVIQLG